MHEFMCVNTHACVLKKMIIPITHNTITEHCALRDVSRGPRAAGILSAAIGCKCKCIQAETLVWHLNRVPAGLGRKWTSRTELRIWNSAPAANW